MNNPGSDLELTHVRAHPVAMTQVLAQGYFFELSVRNTYVLTRAYNHLRGKLGWVHLLARPWYSDYLSRYVRNRYCLATPLR